MIILVDKPKGITSFDAIRQLRRELGIKKMGHAGTLDPLASGLLIIATEEDTKKLEQFLKLPKTYEVGIRLGEKRDTGDLEGEVIESCEVGEVDEEKVQEVLKNFVKVHTLPVPIYSAIKVNGRPLYWYARNNEPVEIPEKEMEVTKAEFLRIENNEVYLSLSVSSGTYIRALVQEFGRMLGYPATTSYLRRIEVGDFNVKDAKKMEPLREA
ncbi:MAG: tRNA pseudouridine(55) synthase TruB [Patescibacteria group bacterium UBA2103]